MKRLFILFAFFINTYFATAQWVKTDSLPTSNSLFKIKFADKNTGYAVGAFGTIIKTSNGGKTWKLLNNKSNIEFSSIFCSDSNNVYIGAHNSILKTTDGGSTWSNKSIGNNYSIYSIYFTDSFNGFAVGGNGDKGLILKTSDKGKSWINQKIEYNNLIRDACFVNKDTGFVVGDYGTYKTKDAGVTWSLLNKDVYNSICFINKDIGYVVGRNNAILKTVNGGDDWSLQHSDLEFNYDLNYIVFPSQNYGYIFGEAGIILRTINAGDEWSQYRGEGYSSLFSASFIDSITGFAVGGYGTILKTVNGGGFEDTTYVIPKLRLEVKVYNVTCEYKMVDAYLSVDSINHADSNTWVLINEFGKVFPLNYSGGHFDWSISIPNYEAGSYSISVNYKRRGRVTTITKPNAIVLRNSPSPNFEINTNPDSVYSPALLKFINYTKKGDGDSLEYLWDFGDQSTSYEINPVHEYSNIGTYYVKLNVTDNFGCDASNSNFIIVKDSIQKNEFNYITSPCSDYGTPSCGWGKHFIIQNDTLKIYGQIGGNCCTAKTATVTTKPDTIFIRTFEYGPECTCGCSYCFAINVPNVAKDSIIVSFDGQLFTASTTLSKKDSYLMNNDIKIFPNPVKNNFTIDFSTLNQKKYQIEIYSISGERVYENKLIDKSRININSEGFIPGIYFVKTFGDKANMYLSKIVIE